MKVLDEVKLNIIDTDHLGLGIAKIDGFPIFVNNALPGEEILARIDRITKNLAMATNLKILKKSNDRNEELCPYYNECGGCNIMHMNYNSQLEFKTKITKDTIYKVSSLSPKINFCEANKNIYGYRNKIIVPLGMKDNEIISGFYEAKSHNIVPMEKCLIEPNLASLIIEEIKKLLSLYNVAIYDEINHTGIIRNIMIRISDDNKIMVVFVALKEFKELSNIVSKLTLKFKSIVSVYLNINKERTNVVLGRDFKLLYGDKYLIETINNLKFYVHPNSFLQINHYQCENLYKKAIKYANINKEDVVIDAYCGIGSISLNIAKEAKYVYGIEIVKEAVLNANENKKLNNITNASFICGACEDEIMKIVKNNKIDVIFFDPPRKGCDQRFLDTVIKSNIPKIVYISCKTSTFARDVKILCDNGYELKEVTPFDLFSHQTHTECLGILMKKQ